MEDIAIRYGKGIFEKHLDAYSPQDPLYENYTDKKGRTSAVYTVQGTISGSVRVVSLTSGQVLASQRFEGAGETKNYAGYPDPTIAMARPLNSNLGPIPVAVDLAERMSFLRRAIDISMSDGATLKIGG